MISAPQLADALADHIEAVAVELLGDPTQRAGNEWRWNRKGSLSVSVRGAKRGSFYSHEHGQGGDALELVKHALGGSTTDAMRWAADRLGGKASTYAPQRPAKSSPRDVDDLAEQQRKIDGALTIWNETTEIRGTVADAYLRSRGIELPDYITDLKFHPACPGAGLRIPAMVALFRDAGTNEPCGIHRTFLSDDGSGKHELGKRMMGRAKDAVIKLTDDAEVTTGLGLAEGIENALTLAAYGWWPIWAAGSAGSIRNFPVLDGIEALTIFADVDDGGVGLTAARECAARWSGAGKLVEIQKPPAGTDWNDFARSIAA